MWNLNCLPSTVFLLRAVHPVRFSLSKTRLSDCHVIQLFLLTVKIGEPFGRLNLATSHQLESDPFMLLACVFHNSNKLFCFLLTCTKSTCLKGLISSIATWKRLMATDEVRCKWMWKKCYYYFCQLLLPNRQILRVLVVYLDEHVSHRLPPTNLLKILPAPHASSCAQNPVIPSLLFDIERTTYVFIYEIQYDPRKWRHNREHRPKKDEDYYWSPDISRVG